MINTMKSRSVDNANKATERVRFEFVVLALYFCSLAFEGPLRTALSLAKAETLIYMRDFAALAIVLYHARLRPNGTHPHSTSTIVFLYILASHSVLGLWLGHSLVPVAFGFKLFLSVLFGISCAHSIRGNEGAFRILMAVIFIGSSFGVYLNAAIGQFPWEGSEFDTAFGTVQNTRLWWAGGERRLPGLSRASYTAAAIIGLTAVFLSAQISNPLPKIAIALIASPAIYLTTSKGVIISYVIATAWTFLPNRAYKNNLASTLLWVFSITAAVAPFVSTAVEFNPSIVKAVPKYLSSFAERAAVTWPDALHRIPSWYQWIIGQGLGGVASPLRYGHQYSLFNPVDNLFLYIFLNFGAFGVIYYFLFTRRFARIANSDSSHTNGFLAMALLILGYGITAHLLEDAFISIVIGILIAYPLKSEPSEHNGQSQNDTK